MAKATVFVKENGGLFDPNSQEITLLYRGQILNKDKVIGNYTSEGGIIQIFIKNKKTEDI